MEKREKNENQSKFWKCVLWTVLSYVVISLIASVCHVVGGNLQDDGGAEISWFAILEVAIMPVLFYIAGYFGSDKYDFEKFKTYKIWIFAAGFSAILMVLWYFALEAYVLLNLPAAEGSYALDLFLRKITVVKDYTVLYLKETDEYKYVILPLIHFAFRLVYWLLYALGNRKYVKGQKRNARA